MHILYFTCCSNIINYNLGQNLKLYMCWKFKHQPHYKISSFHYAPNLENNTAMNTKGNFIQNYKTGWVISIHSSCTGCGKTMGFFWVLPGLFRKWSSEETRSTKVLVHWITSLTGQIGSDLITIWSFKRHYHNMQ